MKEKVVYDKYTGDSKRFGEELAIKMNLPMDKWAKQTREKFCDEVEYTFIRQYNGNWRDFGTRRYIDNALSGNLSSWFANELCINEYAPFEWRKQVVENMYEKYNVESELNTCVNDIYDIDNDNIEVDLEVWLNGNYETSYSININLRDLGITENMDYEFQLSKDLNRIVRRLYEEKNKIPSLEDIKKEISKIQYFVIELRK